MACAAVLAATSLASMVAFCAVTLALAFAARRAACAVASFPRVPRTFSLAFCSAARAATSAFLSVLRAEPRALTCAASTRFFAVATRARSASMAVCAAASAFSARASSGLVGPAGAFAAAFARGAFAMGCSLSCFSRCGCPQNSGYDTSPSAKYHHHLPHSQTAFPWRKKSAFPQRETALS